MWTSVSSVIRNKQFFKDHLLSIKKSFTTLEENPKFKNPKHVYKSTGK